MSELLTSSGIQKLVKSSKQEGVITYADLARAMVENKIEATPNALDELVGPHRRGLLARHRSVRVLPNPVLEDEEEDPATEKPEEEA